MLPLRIVLFLFPILVISQGMGSDFPQLSASQWNELKKGHPVLFSNNPNCPCTKSKSYVNGAVMIPQGAPAVWNVVNDPEAAPSYIEDLKTARILGARGNSLYVEQGMKVQGFRNLFKYVVRVEPTPNHKVLFEFESGKLRNMDGGWWIYPLNQGAGTLLVYSMHLDPGRLTPKSLVRSSLQRKIPETLVAIRGEILRRANTVAKN